MHAFHNVILHNNTVGVSGQDYRHRCWAGPAAPAAQVLGRESGTK